MTAVDPLELSPYLRYRADPWRPIAEAKVWTKKEDSAEASRVLLPAKPYFWHLLRLWQGKHPALAEIRKTYPAVDHRFMFTKKSRRMMATWLVSWAHLWLALYRPDSMIGVGARKEEYADWLLQARYKFMFDNLDPICFDGRKPTMTTKACLLSFSNGSTIMGIASGSDQWRQFTFTGAHMDEAPFWEDFDRTWEGARPACGRAWVLGSPEDGTAFKTIFENQEAA